MVASGEKITPVKNFGDPLYIQRATFGNVFEALQNPQNGYNSKNIRSKAYYNHLKFAEGTYLE